MSGGNDQGWHANLGDSCLRIEVADRAATADVAFRIHGFDIAHGCGDDFRGPDNKIGSEPSLRSGARDFRNTFGTNHFDPRIPGFACSDFRSGAAERQFVQTFGRL